MDFNKGRRTAAIMIALAVLLTLNVTTSFAAIPLIDVNTSYDLQIDSDWGINRDNLIIVPAGDEIFLSGLWYNGRTGAGGQWIRNSKLQYTWRSSNRDLVGQIQGANSWYDPEPAWDPSEMITACFASAKVGDRIGSAEVSCKAIVDPAYKWTGTTDATATVQVVGLTVDEEEKEINLGESVTLTAYWTPSLQDPLDKARTYFAENALEPELWNGAQDEWSATLFTTPGGVEVDGEEALAAAVGPLTAVKPAAGGFGTQVVVTPTQAGTYEFTCSPALGTVPTTVTVEVVPPDSGPQMGLRMPDSDLVYVPAAAEEDELWQEFAVETEPGYYDGEPEPGTVYWSVLEAGENAFLVDDSDELLYGETLELELAEFFADDEELVLSAWLVPRDVMADMDEILAYGADHPEAVAEWTLVPVDAPVLETIAGSDIVFDEESKIITGLTAGAAGMNPEQAVLAQFYWNAGSSMSIVRENGTALGEDESVGTGCMLRMTFPDTNINDLEATFVVTGDVTGSGTITITDLVQMARALNDPDTLSGLYLQAADFTATGTITVTDLVREAGLLRTAQVE